MKIVQILGYGHDDVRVVGLADDGNIYESYWGNYDKDDIIIVWKLFKKSEYELDVDNLLDKQS